MPSLSQSPKSDVQLDEVVAGYLQVAQLGTPPDREQLLAEYPHLAEGLHKFFGSSPE